jgi:acyl carrier protein
MSKRADYAGRLKALVNEMKTEDVTVEDDTDLVDEVGLSSVEIMELVEAIEDTYDISFPLNDLAEMRTIADLAAEIERLVDAA